MNERDPELDALWRKHSAETPPAALDDAIRAAAHRAIHAKPAAASPRARAPWPTWATFAAAASIGAIAIGVWQLQPREVDETRVVASDMPVRAQPPAPRVAAEPATTPPPATMAKPDTQAAVPGLASNAPSNASAARTMTRDESAPLAQAAPASAAASDALAKDAPAAPAAGGAATDKVQGDAATLRETAEKPSPFPGARVAASPNEAASPAMALTAKRGEVAPTRSDDATADRSDDVSNTQRAAAASPATAPPAPVRALSDYIESLRRALAEHRDADAVALLADMRVQFADAEARLPLDLRQWAAGIPRARPSP